MQRKFLILLLVLLMLSIFTGCTSGVLPVADEPAPEPQPDPTPITASRVAVMELFEGPACTRCAAVHSDIVKLRQEYGFDELIILEEYSSDYGEYTGWGVHDVLKRFWNYLNYLGIDGELPDAYFNGLNQTVHHSDMEGYDNYKTAIEAELAKSAKIAISASYEATGYIINITGRVFNISDSTLNNIVVEAMVYEDSVDLIIPEYSIDTIANHVVRDIITYEESGETIDSFAPGESYEFSLTSSSLSNVHDMSNIHVVVYVQAPYSSTKEILQALYVE